MIKLYTVHHQLNRPKNIMIMVLKILHIVDLDGALTGKTVNIDLIKDIANNFDFKIEVGGGIRTIDSIKEYIDVGIEKVILGSAAIKNKKFLKEACGQFKKFKLL